jgi:hypothetical protein
MLRSLPALALSSATLAGSNSRSRVVRAVVVVSSVREYDDLVALAPDLRVVAHQRVRVVHRLPRGEHLVHAAPEQVRADRALEVVHERMHLLVRERPVPLALLVGDVEVERRDRAVDELATCQPPVDEKCM